MIIDVERKEREREREREIKERQRGDSPPATSLDDDVAPMIPERSSGADPLPFDLA